MHRLSLFYAVFTFEIGICEYLFYQQYQRSTPAACSPTAPPSPWGLGARILT
jgi:hypothetical protein